MIFFNIVISSVAVVIIAVSAWIVGVGLREALRAEL